MMMPPGIPFLVGRLNMRPRPRRLPTREFASTRDHRKLATVVLLLGLMMIVFQFVGKPESWHWFTHMTSPPGQPPLDTRIQGQALRPVEPGDVVVVPSIVEKAAAEPATSQRKLIPGVTEKLLSTIRDDAPFSSGEHEPFFQILNLVNVGNPAELDSLAEADIPFSQLYNQPAAYRGRVLRLKGLLQAAFADVGVASNEFGIEKYHELWVRPADRPKHEVYAVYCLDLPSHVPRGRTPKGIEPGLVEFTGVYFKRWAYPATDGIRNTPLILAKTIDWKPAPPVIAPGQVPVSDDYLESIGIAVGIALVVAAGVVWYATRKPTPDPTFARLTALSSGRRASHQPLDGLRERVVSAEAAAALRRANEGSQWDKGEASDHGSSDDDE